MAILGLDTETYTRNERGMLVPIKNAKDFVIGCVIEIGRKKPHFFYTPDEMFSFLLDFVNQRAKEGHNTFIYSHSHSYDLYAYAQNHLKETKVVTIKKETSGLFGYLGDTTNSFYCKECDKTIDEKDVERRQKDKGMRNHKEYYCKKCNNKVIKKGVGYLLDTLSFYSGKLEDLGHDLGLPKGEMPKEIKDIVELKGYVYRDTQIVVKFIETIINKLSELGYRPKKILTAGQLSMNSFRTFCDRHFFCETCKDSYDIKNIRESFEIVKRGNMIVERKIHFCNKCNNKVYKFSSYFYKKGRIYQTQFPMFLKRACKGSRNESYKGIEDGTIKDVTGLDLRGLYPFSMAEKMKMPDLRTEEVILCPDQDFSREELLNMIGVAEAKVEFPKNRLGYLPIRYHSKTYFPFSRDDKTIKGEGVWTLFELKRFVEEGGKILEISKAIVYNELPFNPFTLLMRELYQIRKNADKNLGFVIKIIMNSLHGKFAEMRKEVDRVIVHKADNQEYIDKGYIIKGDFGEECSLTKIKRKKYSTSAHPMIYALTTAYARDEIYKHLKKVPLKDLCYCDTDSCYFRGNHLDKFKVGDDLGDFKIEFKDVNGLFIKEKVYSLSDNKGIPIRSRASGVKLKNLSEEQLKGKQDIIQEEMHKLNTAYLKGTFDKVGTFSQKIKRIDSSKRKREIALPPMIYDCTDDDMVKQE